MGTQGERYDDPSDDVPIDELVAMFRKAAKNGPCPDAAILEECAMLHRTTWVRRWENEKTAPRGEWQPLERNVRKALKLLAKDLPPLLEFYRKFALQPSFDEGRFAILTAVHMYVPRAMAALPVETRKPIAYWHAPASLIAAEAMEAWQKAGRTRFGHNPTSPLVRFTRAFLARAGIEPGDDVIAAAFRRGLLDGLPKGGTT